MNAPWLFVSAATIVVTAGAHAIVGERRLIGPIVDSGVGPMQSPLGRSVLRFAWHLTSLLMLLVAIVLIDAAMRPANASPFVIGAIGVTFAAAGVYDAFASKGRHIGWPMLTIAGLAALLALV